MFGWDVKQEHDGARAMICINWSDSDAVYGNRGVQEQRHNVLWRHPHVLLQQDGCHWAAVYQAGCEVPGQTCIEGSTTLSMHS